MNVGIYIYDQAEVLDFSGPFEVFSVASRFLEENKKFNVFLVSESSEPIKARGGYSVNPNYNFSNHPKITPPATANFTTHNLKLLQIIQLQHIGKILMI